MNAHTPPTASPTHTDGTPGSATSRGLTAPDATVAPAAEQSPDLPWYRDPEFAPSIISGIALAIGMALHAVTALAPIAAEPPLSTVGVALQIPFWIALVAGAWTFVPETVQDLTHGEIGVGLLMTIAAVGAVLLGQVESAAALAFLFSLSETLEDRAMDRAQDGLRALLDLIPPTARVLRTTTEADQPPIPGPAIEDATATIITLPVDEIRIGDVLVVGAGERIATDGMVMAGTSSIDASAVTGESIPVEVGPGSPVQAGTVNGAGRLRVTASADGTDNSVTRTVAIVEEAQARKGRRARMADRIARPLVPTILVIAVVIAVVGSVLGDPATWIERALVVLVAASPCALAIAVPVTVISAIGAESRFGVVVTSGVAFEDFGTIRSIAFDKTGTLTAGRPRVTDVTCADGVSRDDVLQWSAALESTSTHPLASAILEAVAEAGTPSPTRATAVSEDAGHGLSGTVDGRTVRLGNPRWIDPGCFLEDAEAFTAAGKTVMVIEVDGAPSGLIAVRDELRSEAPETIRMLRDQGLSTVMLTGDNARTAQALASEAGIEDVRAEQLPADKAAAVAALSEAAPTAMVGDGINDAPALATATVGIAMGTTGSAAAIESADIAFTGRDLRLIPQALAHARRARRIMTVNIALALVVIAALFPLAVFGVLGLASVVLVHEVAEVVIILNGVRAARRPPSP